MMSSAGEWLRWFVGGKIPSVVMKESVISPQPWVAVVLLAASARCIAWGKRQRDVGLSVFFGCLKSKYLTHIYFRTRSKGLYNSCCCCG